MTEVPSDLLYSREHEWVRVEGATARVGVTEYAARELGDIVYVSAPTVGAQVVAGDPCGELESTKSVSDLFAPATGIVSAVNEALDESPETVNAAPYEEGWLFEVELADDPGVDELLDAEAYQELIGEQ
ncbi:glycine cleavage system H protein [Propionibacterium cyclohexanicum]|uniref:Glycine cleavage system H protein n=1 Tax=Propionibacterium cyclohexanicum TaxID=64702 RepID=A0A1H9QPH0_9ACTN|nr:glycine cleavage system protein GcvH [Propionibacterium cyclohexanicum]SER61729.1 glycine cleavage system H protein [Propionibacterium cyclohexanicum]